MLDEAELRQRLVDVAVDQAGAIQEAAAHPAVAAIEVALAPPAVAVAKWMRPIVATLAVVTVRSARSSQKATPRL